MVPVVVLSSLSVKTLYELIRSKEKASSANCSGRFLFVVDRSAILSLRDVTRQQIDMWYLETISQ